MISINGMTGINLDPSIASRALEDLVFTEKSQLMSASHVQYFISPLKPATGHPAARHQTKGQVENEYGSIWRPGRGGEG